MKRKTYNARYGCGVALLFALLIMPPPGTVRAQNVSYGQLYNNSDFARNIDLSRPVGVTEGAVNTTPSGAVNYSIPVKLPPGTGKMIPTLALLYNSQGDNGIAGMGWDISGLSAISRSFSNCHFENRASPLNFNSLDPFSLNGTRLLPLNGTNGASGTTYGLEIESYGSIQSFGSIGSGPQWFRMITKEGITYEFGNTTDSRVTNDNNTEVLSWRVNRIHDNYGNYVDFIYDNNQRDFRISEIRYTGNYNTGLQPYNSVKFYYLQRSDQNTQYEKGTTLNYKYLLDKIVVTAEGQQAFKTYLCSYGYDNIYSFLTRVAETGADGTTLNSTIFKYGEQPADMTVENTGIVLNWQDRFAGDFNGDGYGDVAFAERSNNASGIYGLSYHDQYTIYKGGNNNTNLQPYGAVGLNGQSPTSVDNPDNRGQIPKSAQSFFASDFNADGKDDILRAEFDISNGTTSFSRVVQSLSNGNGGFTDVTLPLPPVNGNGGNYGLPFNGQYLLNGDFNGDKIADFLCIGMNNGFAYMFMGNKYPPGTGLLPVQFLGTISGINDISDADQVIVLDFDGDGRSDIMAVKNNQSRIFGLTDNYNSGSYTTLQLKATLSYPQKNDDIWTGDFNGDGKTDIITRDRGNSYWQIGYANGWGFASSPFNLPSITLFPYEEQREFDWKKSKIIVSDKIIIGDFNGDGKSDILHVVPYMDNNVPHSHLYRYTSRGNSFYQAAYDYTGWFSVGDGTMTFDMNGDGRTDIVTSNENLLANVISFGANGKERLLEKITNGFNYTTTIGYDFLNKAGSYSTSTGLQSAPYLRSGVRLPVTVVEKISQPDGTGGVSEMQFQYGSAVFYGLGKGFLGFEKIAATNAATGMRQVSEYSYELPFGQSYLAKSYTESLITGAMLSSTETVVSFTNLGNKRYAAFPISVKEINGLAGTYKYTTNSYDSYGNIIKQTVDLNGIEQVSTATNYIANSGTPVPALPSDITETRTRNGAPPLTTKTTFAYNNKGSLTFSNEYDVQPLHVNRAYVHDAYGNVTDESIFTPNTVGGFRHTLYVFDPKGRYPVKTTNPLGQTETATYDPRWGKPLSVTTKDELTTLYKYSGFGDLVETILPEGYSGTHELVWNTGGVPNAVFFRRTIEPGRPMKVVFFDFIQRELEQRVFSFKANLYPLLWYTSQLTTYDNRGNIATRTNRYLPNETPLVTSYSYDNYNRVSSESNALGITSYGYAYANGELQSTRTNPAGQATTVITDAANRKTAVKDNGGTIKYTYDSHGNLLETKHDIVVLSKNTYDAYDRLTATSDMDMGTLQYTYDGYGELTEQTDANGNHYMIAYDVLGRKVSRTGPEGTTTYEYYGSNTGVPGIANQLKAVTGFNGIDETFEYDNFGRKAKQTKTIDGIPYTTSYSYDQYSNLSSIVYPSGLKINNEYDNLGNLKTVAIDGGKKLFIATDMNGYGQYTQYTTGNGLSTENTYIYGMPVRYYTPGVQDLQLYYNIPGRKIIKRYDGIKDLTENFAYDNLNRLVSSTVITTTGQSYAPLTLTYDNVNNLNTSMGNIKAKSDAGIYAYNGSTHAVSSISSPQNISLLEQDVDYTPFQKAAVVKEDSYELYYTYGPGYERCKSTLKQNGVDIENRLYAGPGYETFTDQNNQGLRIHYIPGGDGICAIIIKDKADNQKVYYPYKDHLSSVLALTDENGTVVEEQNFDAWGRERNAADWTYSLAANPQFKWLRGFSGHEMLPEFSLVNMNGRIYDPVVGRMLSADNYVSATDGTQAFNRYSYVGNDPLNRTDPSGNNWVYVGAGLIGGGMNLYNNWHKVRNWQSGVAYFASGAAGGITTVATKNIQLGTSVTMCGNVMIDVATGNAPSIKKPQDAIMYMAKTFFDGLSAAGGGPLSEAIFEQLFAKSIVYSTGAVATNELASGNGVIYAELQGDFTVTASRSIGGESAAGSAVNKAVITEEAEAEGGLILYKGKAIQTENPYGWKTGDRMFTINESSPKMIYKKNMSLLRSEMNTGKPIGDSYLKADGTLETARQWQFFEDGSKKLSGQYLNAERYMLENRGWKFNSDFGQWLLQQR